MVTRGIWKRGSRYALRYRHRGVNQHEPLNARTLQEARACRAQRLEEIHTGRYRSPADKQLLGPLLDEYLAAARYARRDRRRIKRIQMARRQLLSTFGSGERVGNIRSILASEPARVPSAHTLRAAVRWAEWRSPDACGIGSVLFNRYADRLFRAIHPQVHGVWHRWKKPWAEMWAGAGNQRRSHEALAQANARLVERIASVLATAIVLDAL